MDLREIVWKGVDWSRLSQDMDQWRAVERTDYIGGGGIS